jgi:hypothetical protein
MAKVFLLECLLVLILEEKRLRKKNYATNNAVRNGKGTQNLDIEI